MSSIRVPDDDRLMSDVPTGTLRRVGLRHGASSAPARDIVRFRAAAS